VKRLAMFWLACAAVGFLTAIAAAFALSLALDGAPAWRSATAPRMAERSNQAAPRPGGLMAPALGPTR